MKEKRKGGLIDGVAYANGKGGYLPFAKKPAKAYSGQARATAAKRMKKG